MIDIIIKDLPYRVSQQLNIEYDKRLSDINHLVSGRYEYYSNLKNDIETIELLLALSIFYKRILSNFDSATKFNSRIIFGSSAESIQLGTYELTKNEIFRINGTIKAFRELMHNYQIPLELFNYLETKDFLRKVKIYKDSLDRKNNG